MKRSLLALVFVLLASMPAAAQVVAQGPPGSSPWTIKLDQTGSNNNVDVDTLPSVTIGVFPDNEPININQIGGAAVTLGQKLSASSLPVVIASDQSTLPVSGTVTANAGSGTFTNQQSNQTADYDTGASTQTTTMFGWALPASGGPVAGGTATNPIRTDPTGSTTQPVSGTVTANAGSGTFTVSGTVTANAGTNLNTSALALESGGNLAGAATSLAIIDDWDESDRAKVNPIVGQAGVAAGAGAVGVTTQRTTLASDDPAVTSLQIIDDWDESDRAKVNPIVGQAGVQGASGTVSANTQRVVLATDVALPTGTNSIGQVTANAGTNLNTSALALESGGNLAGVRTAVETIDNIVSGSGANISQFGGSNVVTGVGASGSGVPRVTVANDSSILGTKTNNNAAAGATNLGALTAVATAANPSYTEGNLVTPSVDLAGRTRVMTPKTTGTCDLVMTSTSNTCEIDVGDGVQGLSFSVEDSGSAWTGTIQFQTNSPNTAVWFFLAGYNISNTDGTNFTNDFDTCTTSLGASAPSCNQNKNGTWLATGVGGIQKIRLKVMTAGTNTARVKWTTTGLSDYTYAQIFGDLQQNDPAQINGSTDGLFTGYAVWPVMQGGHAFSAAAFPAQALLTLPAPVSANNRRATMAMSPWGEPRVMQSDRHFTGSITAGGADCSVATRCVGIATEGAQGLSVQIRGTWVATLNPEMSYDGVNYTPAVLFNNETFTGAFDTTTTTNGSWVFILANGAAYIRIRASAYTSGTATVTLRGHAMPSIQASLVFGDKAHDLADASTSPVKIGYRATTGIPTPVADADRVNSIADAYGAVFTRGADHPNRFTCSADNIGNSLTALSAGCADAATSASTSLYITDIVAQSTTSTAGQFILRSGTAANCGTATASVLPSAASAVRFTSPPNTVAPTVINFTTPIKVTADHGLCVLGIATQTTTIQVNGFIAQ